MLKLGNPLHCPLPDEKTRQTSTHTFSKLSCCSQQWHGSQFCETKRSCSFLSSLFEQGDAPGGGTVMKKPARHLDRWCHESGSGAAVSFDLCFCFFDFFLQALQAPRMRHRRKEPDPAFDAPESSPKEGDRRRSAEISTLLKLVLLLKGPQRNVAEVPQVPMLAFRKKHIGVTRDIAQCQWSQAPQQEKPGTSCHQASGVCDRVLHSLFLDASLPF